MVWSLLPLTHPLFTEPGSSLFTYAHSSSYLGIPHIRDPIPKTTSWDKSYQVSITDGLDQPAELKLYTDGSLMQGLAGYGAHLTTNTGEMIEETQGSLGERVSVFQAECQAILHGLDLCENQQHTDLKIFVDNQAVLKSLDNPCTTNQSIQMVKDSLNRVGSTKTVTLCWIKAHICIPDNERADELAKMGASHTPLGPGPFVPISRTNIHQAVNKNTGDIWNNRWKSR